MSRMFFVLSLDILPIFSIFPSIFVSQFKTEKIVYGKTQQMDEESYFF